MLQGSRKRGQTMALDEDIPSTDDEAERTEKRMKLTETTQALREQVAALQVIPSLTNVSVTCTDRDCKFHKAAAKFCF